MAILVKQEVIVHPGEGGAFQRQLSDRSKPCLGLPAGGRDEALKFIAYSTDTQRLADQASWISYGPARASSAPLVGKYATNDKIDMGPQMPTAPANFKNALQNDFEFWADHQDELNERFNAWLAQ